MKTNEEILRMLAEGNVELNFSSIIEFLTEKKRIDEAEARNMAFQVLSSLNQTGSGYYTINEG